MANISTNKHLFYNVIGGLAFTSESETASDWRKSDTEEKKSVSRAFFVTVVRLDMSKKFTKAYT
jgi:hypothetical protein